MKKYRKTLKIISLLIFTTISFFFLTLQYQKINAGYEDTKEIKISKNQKIKTNNVEFKILDTTTDKSCLNIILNIKQTKPGFYGMKKSNDFFENMWIASPYNYSEHINNENITDSSNHIFDMKKYSSGKDMTAKVSFKKDRFDKNSKFYFLVSDNNKFTKYSLSLN